MSKPNGLIIWQGASLIDGKPIVAIATKSSKNSKTGNMIQTWILRSDVNPIKATQTGDDASICGDCKHRGQADGTKAVGRACYVTVVQAPNSIYKAFLRGRYPVASAEEQKAFVDGRPLRIGAYGDPAAVPFEVWENLLQTASTHTAYTHAWRYCDPRLKSISMASVDDFAEYQTARADGWRTFRVRCAEEPLQVREIACPASEEMGYRTTCADCTLCDGAKSSDARATIAIIAHGSAARNYISLRSLKTAAAAV